MITGKNAVAALFCAVSLVTNAAAQTPNLLRVQHTVVKPDRLSEYLEIQKEYAAIYKKAGIPWRFVYRGMLANTYEFFSITPLDNLAALDNPSPLQKGSTEGDLARLAARQQQCVESNRVSIDRPLPDLNLGPATPTPAPYSRLIRSRVRPGMEDQYIALYKNEIAPALKKGGVTLFRVRRVQYGGPRTEFYTSWGITKLADLDGPSPLEKALGSDGSKKVLDKAAALITLSEYMVFRYLPDVSYAPQ